MPFTVTQDTTVHFMTVSLTLWLGYSQLMINQSLSLLVMNHLSLSLSPTDRNCREALEFCNLSGCAHLIHCPTNIVGNRLDLVMTDVPDVVDVFFGTPLQGTSDHFFVSCVLWVEQSVPNNIRNTYFLKHHTNWDNVRCAVRSCTWYTILKSADPLDAFDRAIGEIIGRLVPTTVLRSTSEDKQWFNAGCRRANDAKQTAYHAWCRARSADPWIPFVLARAEARRVSGDVRGEAVYS